MSVQDCWDSFRAAQANFVLTYAVYHHWRSRGWVPKCGLKYAADFMIYQAAPSVAHAEYAVLVQTHAASPALHDATRSLSWVLIQNLSRVIAKVAKVLVVCYVTVPEGFDPSSPSSLHSLQISSVKIERWKV